MTERFELLEELGAGGMGSVWKARDTETGEMVALKLVHAHLARDPDYVARFEREVEVARRVDSPHVVRVLGYGTRDGIPFMSMEYVEGQSLRELLKERGKLTWDEAKPIVRQVAEGLGAAHAAGVIHRDVKPSNILITPDGDAKLADFGIARALDMTRLTGSSTMLGTPHYMAPDTEVTPASDLYSLGCVLYEMLTGHPPFDGDSQQRILLRHVREEVDLRLVESAEARSMVSRLLQKDPALRSEAARVDAARVLQAKVRASRRGRGRLVALAVIVAVAVGGGVAAVIASGGSGTTPADADVTTEAAGTTTRSVAPTGEWPAEQFESVAVALSWFVGDLLNIDAPAPESIVFDESPCSGACVTTQGTIGRSTLFTINFGVEQGVRVVLEEAAGRWSVGDFSLIGAGYGDVWPAPFDAPSVVYETVSDERNGVWFDVGGIELYPDRIRVRMSFRNETSAAIGWTADVGVSGIKVVAPDGREFPSVAVGGRFASDAPGGLPGGLTWKGYHEFMVPPGVDSVKLHYPGRPPLNLSLRSRFE